MGILVALDVGGKRTGVAISDENQIFAFPHQTVPTSLLVSHIGELANTRPLAGIVLGMPRNLKNEPTDGTRMAMLIKKSLATKFPAIPIFEVDERFTSSMAKQAQIMGGMKKRDRQQKENTDKISAVLILQSFLEQKSKLR